MTAVCHSEAPAEESVILKDLIHIVVSPQGDPSQHRPVLDNELLRMMQPENMWVNMKKYLLIAFAVLLAGSLGFYFYTQSRLDYLPEWYEPDASEPAVSMPEDKLPESPAVPDEEAPVTVDTEEDRTPARKPAAAPAPAAKKTPAPQPEVTAKDVAKTLQEAHTVRIRQDELDDLIRTTLEQQFPGKSTEFMKGVKSTIAEDKVDVEMVVDMEKIPWEDLPKDAQFARGLIEQFGGIKSGSELFLKISGKPEIRENELVFGDNTLVQMGKISYPLKTLAALPGVSDKISRIPLSKLGFKQLTLEDGAMVLGK